MAWWVWVVGGLLLLLGEILTPGGFFIVFFGAGAIIVGALKAAGLLGADWAEWLVFTLSSIAGLLLFRRPLMRRFRLTGGRRVDRLEGEMAVILEDVMPGGTGRAELRGSSWSARTSDPMPLARGQRCRVERVEGLTLWLRPE
jgi:membrane protein implicated in regulation of membrane protease activity